MSRKERSLVEDLFADRHISVLVSTATLAWGVNLPAHTVIIKGTQVYKPDKGAWDELGAMDMLQMLGRAGRFPYDDHGHGIVITQHSELQYYLSLMNMQLPIESQLISQLPDVLIAELALGTVQNRKEAVNWLGYTYLFVRMQKNPALYGISMDELMADNTLHQSRVNLIHAALSLLHRHNLIKYDRRTGVIQVTGIGRVASQYYIKHPSIAVYNESLNPRMNDIELVRLFSLSHEFKNIPVRNDEKNELSKLLEKVPIPVKGSVDDPSAKVNVLLQVYVSKVRLDGFALQSDMTYIQQSAGRIMRALFEIALRRGWSSLAQRCLKWCKQIDRRMWKVQTPLRHFSEQKGVNEDILKALERKDVAWERYYDLEANELGALINLENFGKVLHKLVHQFPRLELGAFILPITRSCVMVDVQLTGDFQWNPKVHGFQEVFWVIVEDVNGDTVLHYEQFILKQEEAEKEHRLVFTVNVHQPLPPHYFVRVISDKWLNCETQIPLSFRHLILPNKTLPHTELLDLQPLPVKALKNQKVMETFYNDLTVFNPIQTQTFTSLYSSNENVLICASAATGKEVCLEFALLKLFFEDEQRCGVYLCCSQNVVKLKLEEWEEKFTSLDLTVAELTGEAAADLKILASNDLIITTAEKFDIVSRRWKQKKGEAIQNIKLLLCDDLHILCENPIYESVISRMRFMSIQMELPLRIVGSAASLSNAKDLSEWLGVKTNHLYNFSPNVRNCRLELMIQGFDQHQRDIRLMAMSRPVYENIKSQSPDKGVIIFTSDRKQCRMVASDLLLHAAADNNPKRFLRVTEEGLKPHLEAEFLEHRQVLKQCLSCGVGFIHEGLREDEISHIKALYDAGALQILVSTSSLAWGMRQQAYLCVIVDTKKFDVKEGQYIDYPVSDILEMVGKTSRLSTDKKGMCVLLTQTSKKDYYKKFIFEPLPVESHLLERLEDIMNTEIVMKNIENKQDALDWLTWTFFYRRLSQNPNYYELRGLSHEHLSDHLSTMVEDVVAALESASCVAVENGLDLSASNLGLIANYYSLRYATVELFSRTVQPDTLRKGLLDILCSAHEFEIIPVREGEIKVLKSLAKKLSIEVKTIATKDKIKLLLYAHFKRITLTVDLQKDQHVVLDEIIRCIQGLVDVLSSIGNLKQCILAMELAQMVVQGVFHDSSPLLQLPHITPPMCEALPNVEDVLDFQNMEDEERDGFFKSFEFSQAQIEDVAKACNRYPTVEMDYEVENAANLQCGEKCKIVVVLDRGLEEEEEFEDPGPVYAPFFPKEKEESYWIVLGNEEQAVAIKRTGFSKRTLNIALTFELPETAGKHKYKLTVMSDSYQGLDQEQDIVLNVE